MQFGNEPLCRDWYDSVIIVTKSGFIYLWLNFETRLAVPHCFILFYSSSSTRFFRENGSGLSLYNLGNASSFKITEVVFVVLMYNQVRKKKWNLMKSETKASKQWKNH